MKNNKTTKDHFELFKRAAREWIEAYGLKGWSFHFKHEKALEGTFASYGYNVQGRIASIYLEPDWKDIEVTERQLRKSAFHEVTHVFLARLRKMALDRVAFEEDVDEEIHNLVRTLEDVLFEKEEKYNKSGLYEQLRESMLYPGDPPDMSVKLSKGYNGVDFGCNDEGIE